LQSALVRHGPDAQAGVGEPDTLEGMQKAPPEHSSSRVHHPL
jgi:hypothetical protein